MTEHEKPKKQARIQWELREGNKKPVTFRVGVRMKVICRARELPDIVVVETFWKN